MDKIKMKWQVTGLTFTPHQIARRSALAPDQMVPSGKTLQRVELTPFPLQDPSGPGEVNPIPDRCEVPDSEFKFSILNPEAIGLDLLTPGRFVYITIEEAPVPNIPGMNTTSQVPANIRG